MSLFDQRSTRVNFYVCLLITFLTEVLYCNANENQWDTKRSQWEFALENSFYFSSIVADYSSCFFQCANDVNCRSLTYNFNTKNCELSKENRWSKPSLYIRKPNHIYMDMIAIDGPSAPEDTGDASTVTPSSTAAPSSSSTLSSSIALSSSIPPSSSTAAPPSSTSLSSSTAPSSSTTPSSFAVEFDPGTFCLGKSGDFAHPTDCTKYATCVHGTTYLRECGSTVYPGICGLC